MDHYFIKDQATINIGTIGHVAHGKSTLVKAITGIQTIKFKNELERNITIKLGYANCKIFKCSNSNCPKPGCYKASGSDKKNKPFCDQCHSDMILLKHISFIDCPGHEILMATMLTGTSIMDSALLVIAANENCPQPQTSEHLAAIEIMKMKNLIILQNKVDLVNKKKAKHNYFQILKFIEHTNFESNLVIPISAQRRCNIDVLIQTIVEKIPNPYRDLTLNLKMFLIRTFDINKPGCSIQNLKGGVVGGSIISGILKLGEKIEIRPGISTKTKSGELKCSPVITFTQSLNTEKNKLKLAIPGGLIGVGTLLDPSLTRADRLAGQVLGHFNKLPEIFTKLIVSFQLLKRLIGDSSNENGAFGFRKDEILMINIGSSSTGGKILKKKSKFIEFQLTAPICCEFGDKVTLSKRIDKHWRLIGWGIFKGGKRYNN
jgi:translation initiation factor 2 subunit 3